MRKVGYILGFLVAVVSFSFSQVMPDKAAQEAWQAFNQQHGGNAIIRWHTETGTPATIYGFKSKAYVGVDNPVQIARQFLRDNQAMFKMKGDVSDLRLLRDFTDNGFHHVDFRQLYGDDPVYGAEYSVVVGNDKTVHMAGGRYYPEIVTPTVAVISENEAITQALDFFSINRSDVRDFVIETVVVPGDAPFYAYRLELNQWEAVINAATGEMVDYFERILRIDGIGNIYPIDPVNSSLTTVPIPNLLGAGYYLDGTYIKVTNDELGDAYSSSSNFKYIPPFFSQHDGTHFDDANVYYHVDNYTADYWPTVGFPGLGTQVLASVHDPYPYGHDNSTASWWDNTLRFGHGITLFWDMAKKDDVIYHEYTHLVSRYIGLGGSEGGGEQSAMQEGYSDYHAASYTNDPQIGDWVTRCTDTGDLRNISNSKTYFHYSNLNSVVYAACASMPGGFLNPSGSPHANGMIWSGALWDLRNALGATVTDFLVYKGLVYKHAAGTAFLDGREGIIIADQTYYSGSHVSTIMAVFDDRGIPPDLPPATPTGLTITNAGQFGQYVQLTWNANPEPDMNHYKVWRECTYMGDPYCNLQVIGTTAGTSYTDNYVTIERHGIGMEQFMYYVSAVDNGSNESAKSLPVNTWGEWWYMKGMDSEIASLPEQYALHPAHPNPFNPSTTIQYDLPEVSRVQLVIYDLAGRTVTTLVSGVVNAGYGAALWHGRDEAGRPAPTGVYIYRIIATGLDSGERFTQTRKMVLLK